MPLEGLRYDITPIGMHYLLTHFDIPAADAATWEVEVGGRVARRLTLSIAELRGRPAITMPVTMECAGNGRARMEPRPLSQPWLDEAIGTGTWTGTPLAPILEEAGLEPDAVEIVFRGADHGTQGERRARLRAEPVDRRRHAGRGDPGVRAERPAASAAARVPGPTARARLVRHDQREVAAVDHRRRRAVRRVPDVGLPAPAARGGRGNAGHAHDAARADDPAGVPRLLHPVPHGRGRRRYARRTRVVRMGERLDGRGQRGRRRVLDRGAPVGARRRARVARMDACVDGHRRASTI